MHQYRVVRYSPEEREGTAPAWTSMSDIGESFGGVVLTEAVYLETEERHLAAVRRFAAAQGVTELCVDDLEVCPESSWWQRVAEGDRLPLDEALELVRSVLREDFVWCRFSGDEGFFVHLGYDYYLYIGLTRAPEPAVTETRRSGLHVDLFESPYLDLD
ncbi:hypothetical protein SAMN05216371_2200 [Streptomyces sp. TLI_053]|uniref:hypothetical protein n=1 Tax=Streptomyces sp. TLI_053 TaxID=1855352 RepID=UPI00087B244A|nr:hypothetical protein [Streptomyces sp. TLI_053]SDT41106.1 hypothetical protein SAMN05216371_2200 [Streptomyces sp. TLI_053]